MLYMIDPRCRKSCLFKCTYTDTFTHVNFQKIVHVEFYEDVMSYINPKNVLSPKSSVRAVRVLEDKQEHSFSIARLRYDGREELACRWNGSDEEPSGHPNSRGLPTWFLIPYEMREDIMGGVIRRAKNERPHIFEELELIRNKFPMMEFSGTPITIYPIFNNLTLSDANLLVELISRDEHLKSAKVRVFDLDSDGEKTNDPISQIAGKLHITLYQASEN